MWLRGSLMVTQLSALIDSSAGGKGCFLFLIQERYGGTSTSINAHINTHTCVQENDVSCTVNRNNRTTNQHALFSKLQGKLECESRMKGWSADRAAERRKSFSPDYSTATDYGPWIMRVWPNRKKKKKKWRQKDKQVVFSCVLSGCLVVGLWMFSSCYLVPASL